MINFFSSFQVPLNIHPILAGYTTTTPPPPPPPHDHTTAGPSSVTTQAPPAAAGTAAAGPPSIPQPGLALSTEPPHHRIGARWSVAFQPLATVTIQNIKTSKSGLSRTCTPPPTTALLGAVFEVLEDKEEGMSLLLYPQNCT